MSATNFFVSSPSELSYRQPVPDAAALANLLHDVAELRVGRDRVVVVVVD